MTITQSISILLLAASSVSVFAQSAQEHAAAVLLSQFETIAGTKSDFLLDSESRMHTHFIPSENSLRWPFMGWLGAMIELGPDTAAKIEGFYGTVTVGAKYFHAPRRSNGQEGGPSLGMYTADETYIAIRNGAAVYLDPYFQKTSTVIVLGRPAWTWTGDPYEGHPDKTTYYAQQTGSYLVVSNNRTDFEKVLVGLASDEDPGPPPEWETLSEHSYWLYRAVGSKGNNQLDLGTLVSVSITTDLADGPKGGDFTVHVVDGDITMRRQPRILDRRNLDKFVATGSPGAWEVTLPFTLEPNNAALETLIYWVGFGVNY